MTRVFYSEEGCCLIVEGSLDVYPPRSLRYQSLDATTVEVWLQGESRRVAGPTPFADFEDEAGSTFATKAELLAYLDVEFGRSPALDERASTYIRVTAVGVLPQYRAVTVDGALCEPDEDSQSRYAGLTLEAAAAGQVVDVLKQGVVDNPGWGFQANAPVYLGTLGGLVQTFTSSPARRIGYATSPTELHLDPFGYPELGSANW